MYKVYSYRCNGREARSHAERGLSYHLAQLGSREDFLDFLRTFDLVVWTDIPAGIWRGPLTALENITDWLQVSYLWLRS